MTKPAPAVPRGRCPFPCGRTRREFLWETGGGFTALALAYLLDRDGFFSSQAHGAEQSGLTRLIYLHASNAAGDAAVAISLATTVFFAGATSEARTVSPTSRTARGARRRTPCQSDR